MPAVTFLFREKKYKIHAFVDRQVSNTPNDGRLYITVVLRFEGLKGRSVFSGAAIAVPQDWSYYNPGVERNRTTKKGVQLALQRALDDFFLSWSFTEKFDWRDHKETYHRRYDDIAEAFWKEFLNYVEEL